jgi:hypothetical protein
MKVEGGCYCGEIRYVAEGEPQMKAQCHCRECQYISGGHPNVVMGMPPINSVSTTCRMTCQATNGWWLRNSPRYFFSVFR